MSHYTKLVTQLNISGSPLKEFKDTVKAVRSISVSEQVEHPTSSSSCAKGSQCDSERFWRWREEVAAHWKHSEAIWIGFKPHWAVSSRSSTLSSPTSNWGPVDISIYGHLSTGGGSPGSTWILMLTKLISGQGKENDNLQNSCYTLPIAEGSIPSKLLKQHWQDILFLSSSKTLLWTIRATLSCEFPQGHTLLHSPQRWTVDHPYTDLVVRHQSVCGLSIDGTWRWRLLSGLKRLI